MRHRYQTARAAFRLFVIVTLSLQCGWTLDPTQPIASYLRTTFTVEDGLPSNVVDAILQTRNGFLWIGTDAGLVRFDGRHFSPVVFRGLRATSQDAVRALAETSNGDLWIGTNFGLARLPISSQLQTSGAQATIYHIGAGGGDRITSLIVGHDGVLWAGTESGLYRYQRDGFLSVIPTLGITHIELAVNGNLLIVAEHQFLEWDGTQLIDHPGLAQKLGTNGSQYLNVLQDHTGAIWFSTMMGIARSVGNSVKKFSKYGPQYNEYSLRAYEDHQGNVWAYKNGPGLVRMTTPSEKPLLIGNSARTFYADRDGELWIGTNGHGLVRFKDRLVSVFTMANGLPSDTTMTVLRTSAGQLWVGNNCGGLSLFNGTSFKRYDEKQGLTNSCVWSLAEGVDHELWVGTWGGGLFRFRDGHFTQYSQMAGMASDVVRDILVARDGSLWLATETALTHMLQGKFKNYTVSDGLSSDHILSVYQDREGRIWAATTRGIDRQEGERFQALSTPHDLFDPNYVSFGMDSYDTLYVLSAPAGISRVEGRRLLAVNEDLDVMSMLLLPSHQLWFSGRHGIFRIAQEELRRFDQTHEGPMDYFSLGREDGLVSTQCSDGSPNMALAPDGKLWIATVQGLARIDTLKLKRNYAQPTIFLEDVTVGTKKQPFRDKLSLPPGNSHVELKFDSIELLSPEKIHFQYRLDGVDPGWLDADVTRTAVYTSISPGSHDFHVRACNSAGVWDRKGVAFKVFQQPLYYETNGFRLLAVAGVTLLLVGIYFLRVRQIRSQIQNRMEGRLDERERIARELHDTLLQGVQGLILSFQAVAEHIPDSVAARQKMEATLNRADQVLAEGRDRVKDLRTGVKENDDLAQAFVDTKRELATEGNADFTLVVEGNSRPLHDVVRDEAKWIGREALINAFRHSGASKIEAELMYSSQALQLRFRDDGCGIDLTTLQAGGRPQHWGLVGMRERANKIAAQLDIHSMPGTGTEISLTIPASTAYRDQRDQSLRSWLRRIAGVGR
jgi:ligand-binding sensor domain-containing protein